MPLCAFYRYTPVVHGAFLPKRTGYSQCIYQNAPVIVSALVNTLVIVSALNHFYQNALVIVSALEALCDLYCILSLRYLMSKHLKILLHHKVPLLHTIYRYTPVVDGAFLPKCTDYSQCAKGSMRFVSLLKFYVCDPLFYIK